MPRWTIADVIAAGDTIYANCSDPRCFASTKLDLDALAARLGPDHGAMHDDLTPLLKCSQCRAEGRPHRRPSGSAGSAGSLLRGSLPPPFRFRSADGRFRLFCRRPRDAARSRPAAAPSGRWRAGNAAADAARRPIKRAAYAWRASWCTGAFPQPAQKPEM